MQNLTDDIAHVSRLLRAALGLRGATIGDQIRHGGRLLPRKVRAAAQRLAEAEAMAGVPKLAKQLDYDGLTRDYKTCVQHLGPLSIGHVRHALWYRALSWSALIVVLVIGVYAFVHF